MTPSQKNQFDALMALAEFRRQLREARIGREWQINVLVWAVLAGLILKPELLAGLSHRAAAVLAIVVLHLAWLRWHWRKGREDGDKMFALHKEATNLLHPAKAGGVLSEAEKQIQDIPPRGLVFHLPFWLQIAADVLFAIAILLAPVSDKPEVSLTATVHSAE